MGPRPEADEIMGQVIDWVEEKYPFESQSSLAYEYRTETMWTRVNYARPANG